jgi:hypothetical protein
VGQDMNDEQTVYDAIKRLGCVNEATAHAEGIVAKPKRRPPRPYFARLDPRRDLKKQMASRMVQFLRAESDANNAANRVQGRGIRGPRNPVHVCAVLTHPHMHANCSL